MLDRRFARAMALTFLSTVTILFLVLPAADAQDRGQPRTAGVRFEIPPEKIEVDDGDTVTIDWSEGGRETVRILGIDTPEIQHVQHNLPFDQPYGREAAAFAKGVFAAASEVELLRASMIDRYGRTLGYLFVNGRNYSILVIRAGLAEESVSQYGDNGFPEEASACIEAAREAGPVPFESPHLYRKRMRELSDWMRARGVLPRGED